MRNPQTLADAASELRQKRRRIVETGLLAFGAGVLATSAAFLSTPLAVALGAGAGVELVLATAAFFERRDLIERLALDPAAYILPEVEQYGRRLSAPQARARLAAWIEEVLDESTSPWGYYQPERVAAHAQELASLARDLASPTATVEPPSAVACLRLLTWAVESPLYNPRVPSEELGLRLSRIRAGIRDR